MKSCLLCGACSWGPIPLGMVFRPQDVDKNPSAYRQCDGCGVFAREDLLEEPQSALFVSALDMPKPPDPIMQAVQRMQELLVPNVPTRLERFVSAMLRGRPNLTAIQVVEYCREVEQQLLAPPTTVDTPKWLKFEFADEAACKTFLLSVMEPALERYEDTARRTPANNWTNTLHQKAEVLTNAVLFVLETHVIPDLKDAPGHV